MTSFNKIRHDSIIFNTFQEWPGAVRSNQEWSGATRSGQQALDKVYFAKNFGMYPEKTIKVKNIYLGFGISVLKYRKVPKNPLYRLL